MDYRAAISTFTKKFPTLVVTRCIDYDERHFVIEAVENVDVPNYINPYYGVDKDTGKVTGFIPTLDLDAFFDAVSKHTVFASYSSEEEEDDD